MPDDIIPNLTVNSPPPVKKLSGKKRLLLNLLISLVIFITITLTLGFFFLYVPAKKLEATLSKAPEHFSKLEASLASKNLKSISSELDNLDQFLSTTKSQLAYFAPLRIVPKYGIYIQDAQNFIEIGFESIKTAKIVITAIEPYQDFLGLEGTSTDSNQTTQDRITFLTQSVESIVPHLTQIETGVSRISDLLTQIDPSRYPEDFRGIPAKSSIVKAQNLLDQVSFWTKNGRPLLEKTSWLLGKDAPRTYFLLFQNDAELRPTGGFWTAWGIIKVNNGKFTPVISDDIYSLDARFNSSIPAPRPIKSYHINVPYLNLRDMNLSPDFPTSVETFLGHYAKIAPTKDKIDAVIALDTNVLVDLVKILGRIGVGGYGNFSADPDKRCDGCPQIIYELEWIAGRPRNYIETNRKGFLGPLLHSILANAMGSEKGKIGPLAQAAFNNINQKHVLFYFLDPDVQSAATKANIAGSLAQGLPDQTDYFHLNDSNMSSAKTNLFIRQKIKHEITTQNNKVEHKITITYTNPSRASNCNLEKGDLCLNAPKYRNWFRFYTNPGSQLTQITGSEVEPLVYEELGKQVFEGFYGDKYPLYAKSSSIVTLKYTSNLLPSANYQLYLQKQPGTKPIDYDIYLNGVKHSSFVWNSDLTQRIPLSSP